MSLLHRISALIVKLVERFLPEPFTFAIGMTVVTILLALTLTPSSPMDVITEWGAGLSALLPFIAQMTLIVIFAYALAHLGPIPKLLNAVAARPQTARSAYLTVTLFAGAVSLISWPLGFILGSLLARAIGISAKQRGLRLHYPLLGGSAFGGCVVWHMGYSASAPLFVATPGNAMEQQMGGLIPVSETIFALWNIATAVVTLFVVAMTAALLHPRDQESIEECHVGESNLPKYDDTVATNSPAQWLETSRIPTLLLGSLLVLFAGHWFYTKGLQLDLNIVNWTFLALGVLLARSAREYSQALYSGGQAVAPILLQYPLYGGIMGIMLGTGFVTVISQLVTRVATDTTLPLLAFALGGIVNLFIPSGGAQWTVQGPAFVAAAQELGTDLPLVVMGVAYGDQWTNLIHPFSVLVILILTGLEARKVLAYSAVLFLAAGIPLALGLYLTAIA